MDRRLLGPALIVWAAMWVISGWSWGWKAVGVFAVLGGALTLWSVGHPPMSRGQPVLESVVRRLRGASHVRKRVCRAHPEKHGRWSSSPGSVGLVVCVVFCAVIGSFRAYALTGLSSERIEPGSVADVQVVLRDIRQTTWGSLIASATLTQVSSQAGQWRTRVPVTVTVSGSQAVGWASVPIGATATLSVRWGLGEWTDGISGRLAALSVPQVIRGPPVWTRVVESMRAGLRDAMAHSPPDQAGLVPALVVGDTTGMASDLTEDFRTTGLTHLMAVSGANLAIMLSFLTAVAGRLGVRGRWMTVLSAIGIAAFIALCHAEPSVVRAAAMGVVVLVSLGRGNGGTGGMRALCLAVLCLLWFDPWMARSVGFALSVLACVGIIAWGSSWAEILKKWLPGWVAEAMAVPLAAQIATQPVVSWLSGAVSVAGLAANAAAGVWVGPATIIGLGAALVSPLSAGAATVLGYVAGWCAQPIVLVGRWFAVLPGASHPWPTTPVGIGVVVAACVIAVPLMGWVLRSGWLVTALTCALVVIMLIPPYQPGWPGQGWRVASCDVGQGDATVIRVGQGEAIVMDVGPPDSSVVTCLQQLGVRQVPLLVLTHFHADHVGGLSDVLGAFTVRTLLIPTVGSGKDRIVAEAMSHGIEVVEARGGESATINDVELKVVSSYLPLFAGSDGEESSAENDASLVVRFDAPELSLLGTGDVETVGQQAALVHAEDLSVDIIKVPHHGSARQDATFLAATGASIALVSVGQGNSYGHPVTSTLRILVDAGMTVVRTDEHGAITVSRGEDWSVVSQR
ncbi:MAG: ComEC/Rec2 family competence protein [Propionibacteriaceae bacterium]|nr:ComEC/Rec2 family competence protein [Propionibacteriaceae bacterium]